MFKKEKNKFADSNNFIQISWDLRNLIKFGQIKHFFWTDFF